MKRTLLTGLLAVSTTASAGTTLVIDWTGAVPHPAVEYRATHLSLTDDRFFGRVQIEGQPYVLSTSPGDCTAGGGLVRLHSLTPPQSVADYPWTTAGGTPLDAATSSLCVVGQHLRSAGRL
jgi:hypothetical protein